MFMQVVKSIVGLAADFIRGAPILGEMCRKILNTPRGICDTNLGHHRL